MTVNRLFAWGGAIAAFGMIAFILMTAAGAAVPSPQVGPAAGLDANLQGPGLAFGE